MKLAKRKVIHSRAQLLVGMRANGAFPRGRGTKIGTATTQKMAFYNATPVVQPSLAYSRSGARCPQTRERSMIPVVVALVAAFVLCAASCILDELKVEEDD